MPNGNKQGLDNCSENDTLNFRENVCQYYKKEQNSSF